MNISEIKLTQIPVTLYMCAIGDGADSSGKREAERRAVEALVRHAFGPGVRYFHDEYGAPIVDSSGVYVSVSHCADMALLAVSADEVVGADIELPRAQLGRIAPKFMTGDEISDGDQSPGRLLRLWTAKEAVFKAAGEPELTVSRISVNLRSGEAVIPSGRIFKIAFVEMGQRVIAIATKKPRCRRSLLSVAQIFTR